MAALQQTKSGHVMQMDTQALRIMCQRRNAIPHEFFIDVMKGALKCYDCEGSGLLRYRLSKKRQKPCECGGETAHCWMCEGKGTQLRDERVCVTCHGDGRGRITYETRLNAAKEMAKYVAPQLKQVEVSGSVDVGVSMVSRLAAGRDRARGIVVPIAAKVIESATEEGEDDGDGDS